MDGLSVMEVLTPPCAVLLSRIHLPIVFYQHLIYCLIIDVGRFVSATHPMTIDVNGGPINLRSKSARARRGMDIAIVSAYCAWHIKG